MRVTIDTNFLISSTQWEYSVAHKVLQKLIRGNIEIFSTKEILEEFSKVLKRDFKYNSQETNNILSKVIQFVEIVHPKSSSQIVKDDPDDDKVIDCAIESKSDYILTYDKHLLVIKEYNGIKIIKPEEIIDIL